MDTELAGDTGLLMIAPSPMLTVRPFITENAVLRSRLSFSNNTRAFIADRHVGIDYHAGFDRHGRIRARR